MVKFSHLTFPVPKSKQNGEIPCSGKLFIERGWIESDPLYPVPYHKNCYLNFGWNFTMTSIIIPSRDD